MGRVNVIRPRHAGERRNFGSAPYPEGETTMGWNIDKHGHISKYTDTDQDAHQHEAVMVHNSTGGTITKWMPVYLSGVDATTGLPTIAKAKADALGTLAQFFVVDHNIPDGCDGLAQKDGYVVNTDLDTSGATVGDPVYLSAATAGVATLTQPTGANYSQTLGRVVVNSATVGAIAYHVSGVSSTAALASTVFSDGATVQIHAASAQGYWVLDPANMGSDIAYTFTNEAIAAARTLKFPDFGATTGQVVCTNADQTCVIATGAADRTITLTGDLTRVGAHALTLTTSGTTDVTLPTTGTLTTLATVVAATNEWAAANTFITQPVSIGKDASANSIRIYPATTGNGYLQISATNTGAARNMTITNAALAATSALVIPDAGATGTFAMGKGTNAVLFTSTGATDVTLPTTGTLTTLATVVAATNEWAAGQTFITTPVSVGKDASANSIRVYPATTGKGYLELSAINGGGAFNTVLTNSAVGQTTTYTLPDPSVATGQVVVAAGANKVILTTTGATALTVPTTGTLTTLATVVAATNEWAQPQTFLGDLSVGKDADAAIISIFPATTANGYFKLTATNNASNKYLALTNSAVAQDTTVTVPDPGAATANVVLDAGNATIGGIKTLSSALRTTAGIGGPVANKCTAVEYGEGTFHQTVLTLTLTGDHDLDLADGADHGTGIKIYDFPEGRILILCTVVNGVVTSVNAGGGGATFPMALGTAVGADEATLTGTEADISPSKAIAAGSSQDWHDVLAASAFYDGTGTAKDLYLNAAITDAVSTDAVTIAVTGTITLTWINLGDY